MPFKIHVMSLDSIILPFTADTAKEFPPEMKATERFRISPSLHKVSLVISMDSINKQASSFTSWCNSCDWLPRDNCVFYVEISSRAEPIENKETLTMGMSFHKEGECRKISAKPTGIKKEKDIPRLPES